MEIISKVGAQRSAVRSIAWLDVIGRFEDGTDKSLLKLIGIDEVLMLEHACTLSVSVELRLILVNVNLDAGARNRCADIKLRLARNSSVCKRRPFRGQCRAQISLASQLKVCERIAVAHNI